MSCQTTPYDSKRIVFSRSELQIVNKADVEFSASLSKFFQLVGDYIGFDVTIKASTTEYDLPIDSLLVSGLLRTLWIFPSYEKTEYEALEALEWAFTETNPTDVRWYPLSKILALSGTTDGTDTTKLIKPVMLRNLTAHDVKVKVIASA